MQIFYAPDLTPTDTRYTLSDEESHHCIKVLRMGIGQQMHLIDGRGTLYSARIASAHPSRCQIDIEDTQTNYGKRNTHIHIAIAPTKNIERLEWCIEKCTEIGVDAFTPLLCERSERRQLKPERLQKIIVSAVKQSVKAYMPELNPLTPFEQFVAHPNTANGLFIAHCNQNNLPHLHAQAANHSRIVVLIGPEGDFSPHEVSLAEQHGYQSISLGQSRLRTETAGIVACHLANLFA
ncbi:MAG: 16S rRNA (uracil(1498)-N(3))-methyltransferase [Bacteroidales bacterium]|nr:16S rRNA (uracil(1498)-N(3))-methyltransferase [Bacteroidales bacterium]